MVKKGMRQIMGKQGVFLWVASSSLLAAGCGMGVKRDLSETKPQIVIFDDVCGVQEYHDTLAMKKVDPPEVVSTNEIERTDGKHSSGGKTTFAFEAPYQVQTMKRMLSDNWSRVPDDIMKATRIEVEVRWSEKAGVRRVVTGEDASISINGDPLSRPLPYHVCLSELLFGEPLYKTRRSLLGLSPIASPEETAAAAAAAAPAVAPDEPTADDTQAEQPKEADVPAQPAAASPTPSAVPATAKTPSK
jgi:hypothetical protein